MVAHLPHVLSDTYVMKAPQQLLVLVNVQLVISVQLQITSVYLAHQELIALKEAWFNQ